MDVATYGDEEIGLDEILLEVVASGAWEGERDRLARGLAAGEGDVQPDALRRAENAFRRARGLLAADDLVAWLAARGLGVGDLRAHLRLQLAADHAGEGPVASADLKAAARVAVLLDGTAGDALRRLLRGAAAEDILEPPLPEPGPGEATALARVAAADPALPLHETDAAALEPIAARALRRRLALAAAHERVEAREVEGALAQKRIDWTELEFAELVVSTEPAAREAMLCVSEDGVELAAAGELAGGRYRERRCLASEAVPALRARLLAGEPGTPIGPVPGPEGWSVVVLERRHPPTADDGGVWDRARRLVVAERLERRLAGRVRWHVEL
jgi:hypothetical protein